MCVCGGELGFARGNVQARQAVVDAHPERQACLRVLERAVRISESRAGVASVRESELEQDLRQLVAATRERHKPVEQVSGTVGVAGREMTAGGFETSASSRGSITHGCDGGGLLQQSAGRVERAARLGSRCGRLDLRGNSGVRSSGREGTMRRALLQAAENASRASHEPHDAASAWHRRTPPPP